MPVQSESMLAIVLHPRHLSVAELHFVDHDLDISTLGDIKTPEEAFDSGQLANGEAVGRAIAEFMAEKRISSRKATIVLPEGTDVTQLIKLPVMPRDDMLGAVRSVAERYAIFAEHAIAVDCTEMERVEEDGADMSQVLMAASRLATVVRCQECARVAGLDLVSVETAAVAAARAYRERLRSSETTALAVVGEVKTDVMIFDKGVLRLCYSANAGLAEETHTGDWMAPPSEQGDTFSPPPQLYSELSHCFRFFQHQFPGRAVERVLIAADHPKADVIASHLAEQLQLPVELGRPSHEIRLPVEVDDKAAAFTRALTLALFRGAGIVTLQEEDLFLPLNLLPTSRVRWEPARPAIKVGATLMALVLLGAILAAVVLNNKISDREQRLGSLEVQIAQLQPELDLLRAAKATEQALRNEVERETARLAKDRAVRWSQILVDVAERMPRDMWLTSLASPDSSKISLKGLATNRETIPIAIDSLSSSPYLSNVVLGSLSTDDTYAPGRTIVRYQINAALFRGLGPPPIPIAPAEEAAASTPEAPASEAAASAPEAPAAETEEATQ